MCDYKKLLEKARIKSLDSEIIDSRKVGAVITDSDGNILIEACNKLVAGVEYSRERCIKPEVENWILHAERTAIAHAAKRGISIQGAHMYCTLFPCVPCMQMSLESGISKLITYEPDFDDSRWGESFKIVQTMLDEAKANGKIDYLLLPNS